MVDEKVEPIPPVTVAVIGGTGDGGVKPGLVQTPGAQPNLAVQVVTPILAILVRALNVFFVTLSGLVSASMVMSALPMKTAIAAAFAATLIGLIKDCATVFTGLERKFPLATGSV